MSRSEESNLSHSACQPSALPLGQAGSRDGLMSLGLIHSVLTDRTTARPHTSAVSPQAMAVKFAGRSELSSIEVGSKPTQTTIEPYTSGEWASDLDSMTNAKRLERRSRNTLHHHALIL